MANPAESILEAERQRTIARQILSANIEEDNIQAANELLQEQRITRSRKRSEAGVSPVSKRVKVFSDSIVIAGMNGTLGSNLAQLGEEIFCDSEESRYFAYLSKNGIIELTDSSNNSQLARLGGNHIKHFLLKRFLYHLPALDTATELEERFKASLRNIRPSSLTKIYRSIDTATTVDAQDRLNKDIYKYIVQQHAFKSHMLTDQYFFKCSEMSNMIKFWGPVLESYFGEKEHLFVQWGDTFSVDCRNLNLDYKLDLRVVLGTEKGDVEALTGEFACTKTTTEGKLYKDKLKSVLASKCHLNALLHKISFLPDNQVNQIYIPIIQVMGQNLSLYVLALIDKEVYSVQNIMDVEYPRTIKKLREGGISKIITLFNHVDHLIDNLETKITEYSRDTSNKMKSITGRGCQSHKFKVEEWISEVTWGSR